MSDIYNTVYPILYFSKFFGLANFRLHRNGKSEITLLDFGLLFLKVTVPLIITCLLGALAGLLCSTMISSLCGILQTTNHKKLSKLLMTLNTLHEKLEALGVTKPFEAYRLASILFVIVTFVVYFLLVLVTVLLFPNMMEFFIERCMLLSLTISNYSLIILMGQFNFMLLLVKTNFRDVNILFRSYNINYIESLTNLVDFLTDMQIFVILLSIIIGIIFLIS